MGSPQRRIAIVLDDTIISSPEVVASINCGVGMPGGSTQITGNFTIDEARNLSILIEGGALPVPVEIIEQRRVGPTLGADAIDASAKAAVIGLILTGCSSRGLPTLMGLLATFALATYALISYAALAALGATLTLPGLAGFVLAIGMAIDANVLIFERAREEYAASEKKGLVGALSTGFNKAWSAIIDSNVTTLIAAGLLFFLASGPVQGLRCHAVHRCHRLDDLRADHRPRAHRAGREDQVAAEPPAGQRPGLDRAGPQALRRRGTPTSWAAAGCGSGSPPPPCSWPVLGIFVNGLNLGVEFTGGRLMEYSDQPEDHVDAGRGGGVRAGFPRRRAGVRRRQDRGAHRPDHQRRGGRDPRRDRGGRRRPRAPSATS
jgi:SecD/SecF fusion protein